MFLGTHCPFTSLTTWPAGQSHLGTHCRVQKGAGFLQVAMHADAQGLNSLPGGHSETTTKKAYHVLNKQHDTIHYCYVHDGPKSQEIHVGSIYTHIVIHTQKQQKNITKKKH